MTIVKNTILKGAICAFTFACAALIAAPSAYAQFEAPDPGAILDQFRQDSNINRMEGAATIGGGGGGSLGGRPINEPMPVQAPIIPPARQVTPPKSNPDPVGAIGRPINQPMPVERTISLEPQEGSDGVRKGGVRMSKPIYETQPVERDPISAYTNKTDNGPTGVETAVERKRQIMRDALSLPPSQRPDMRALRKELQAQEKAAQETAVQKFARQEAELEEYFDSQRQALIAKQRQELSALNKEYDAAQAALKKEQRTERSCRMANLGNKSGVAGCREATLPTSIMSRARVQSTADVPSTNQRQSRDVRIGGRVHESTPTPRGGSSRVRGGGGSLGKQVHSLEQQ